VNTLKKLVFPSLSLLLLLVLIPSCITYQTSPSATGVVNNPPYPTSFSVTGITANTEPSNSTGCFNLYTNITVNGPGTVTYRWESIDGGGYSYTWSIAFSAAGTQKISLPVEMSALPSGTYRVHVLTPNDALSNTTYYATCTP
jgi:hypothetical protein